jgi:predicted dehydrogenase
LKSFLGIIGLVAAAASVTLRDTGRGARTMAERHIGIIIHGATGRIGSTQHLRNLMAIRADGGLALANGDRLLPEPFLSGRNATHLAALARANGDLRWTTDLDSALASDAAIFMDCSAGGGRPERVRRAIAAG